MIATIANVVGSGNLHEEVDLEAFEDLLSTPYLDMRTAFSLYCQ